MVTLERNVLLPDLSSKFSTTHKYFVVSWAHLVPPGVAGSRGRAGGSCRAAGSRDVADAAGCLAAHGGAAAATWL